MSINVRPVLLSCFVMFCTAAMAAEKTATKATAPGPSPAAKSVKLFDAIEAKQIEASIIAKSDFTARVTIANKTKQPLTVVMPEAWGAAPVLAQGGLNFNGGGFAINGAPPGKNNAPQPIGSGVGSQLGVGQQPGGPNLNNLFNGAGPGGGGNNGGIGQGIFNIAPGKEIHAKFAVFCLEHGKHDPKPSFAYKLVPLQEITSSPEAAYLLSRYSPAAGADHRTTQAALWHFTNNMSWEQLAAKQIAHLGGLPSEPYYTRSQVKDAMAIAETATKAAAATPATSAVTSVSK